MAFENSSYSTNEAAGGVDVCVVVSDGQLGTNITLQLTIKGTAKGQWLDKCTNVMQLNQIVLVGECIKLWSPRSLFSCCRLQ